MTAAMPRGEIMLNDNGLDSASSLSELSVLEKNTLLDIVHNNVTSLKPALKSPQPIPPSTAANDQSLGFNLDSLPIP